ncbi:MAG: serine/threonine-protein kinase [Planctomycetota bacterium]
MASSSLSLFDLTPGKVLLGHYEVRGPHRENGMSAAFTVIDQRDNGRRELQAFPGALFEGAGQANAFAEKIRAWSEVQSDVLLHLHEVRVLDDGAVLVVTDFPPGISLRAWRSAHGRMDAAPAVRLAVRLLRGLEASHRAGLVHGDIKPETIWFRDEDESAVFVDAGVTPSLWAAKHLGTRTALIGTPFYAPLEQFSGESPDELSDMYNLATVLYELLTGVLPWAGKGYIEVFQSKLQPGPPPMRQLAPHVEVPAAVEAAIARSLRGKRDERYASASELRAALEALKLD